DIHCQDCDFIAWRKLGQLVFHRLENLGSLKKPAGAVFSQIQNKNESEWFSRLTFASEVGDLARVAVVEHLKVIVAQVGNWQISFLVLHECVENDHARFDLDRIFDFLCVYRESRKYDDGEQPDEVFVHDYS